MPRVAGRMRFRADEACAEDEGRGRPERKLRTARPSPRGFDPASCHVPNSRTGSLRSVVNRIAGSLAAWHRGGVRCVALAFAALVLAPSAAAWTPVPGTVQNIVVPSMIVTQAGTELVSFESPTGGTISVSRNRGAPQAVVSNDPVAGRRTQLVQLPSGAIELYFPNAQGVARLESTNDGQTWSAPVQTQSHVADNVQSAAVGPDGTPYFTQDGTGFVNVFRGLNGESVANVYTTCCGYDSTVAVDSSGLVQAAFYSNASTGGAFVYASLGSDLSPAVMTPLAPTVEHTPRVPLVADRSGNTFLAWAPGNPTPTAFTIVRFRGGAPAGDGVTFRASFGGGDPHMALSVDSSDRLWAVWTGQGKLHAARSRSHGAHFGAAVAATLPGTGYQVSAVDLTTGAVDVIVNTGSSLSEQQFLPGLSVKVSKVGEQWWAQALDDGFPVPSATFTVGGYAAHANGAGKAKVRSGSGKAAAPGYTGAAFKVP
jgi:hypothetical protein